jgi:uncharacterized membrane-anchored protein
MATQWEKAAISAPVHEHLRASHDLVTRMRWGRRLKDALAAHEWERRTAEKTIVKMMLCFSSLWMNALILACILTDIWVCMVS